MRPRCVRAAQTLGPTSTPTFIPTEGPKGVFFKGPFCCGLFLNLGLQGFRAQEGSGPNNPEEIHETPSLGLGEGLESGRVWALGPKAWGFRGFVGPSGLRAFKGSLEARGCGDATAGGWCLIHMLLPLIPLLARAHVLMG